MAMTTTKRQLLQAISQVAQMPENQQTNQLMDTLETVYEQEVKSEDSTEAMTVFQNRRIYSKGQFQLPRKHLEASDIELNHKDVLTFKVNGVTFSTKVYMTQTPKARIPSAVEDVADVEQGDLVDIELLDIHRTKTVEQKVEEQLSDREQALLRDLRRVADDVGEDVTQEEYKENGGAFSHLKFYEEFGSWNEAKEIAGLETNPRAGR